MNYLQSDEKFWIEYQQRIEQLDNLMAEQEAQRALVRASKRKAKRAVPRSKLKRSRVRRVA